MSAALLVVGGAFLTSASGSTPPAVTARALSVVADERVGSATAYPVGVRQFSFARGPARPLPTTVWYPASGQRRGKGGGPKTDATPAPGRFPLLVWSHGLHSDPRSQEGVTKVLAAAGFVVVAPAYPYTKKGTARFSKPDVVNQPLDASHVVSLMLAGGNPLAVHIDAARMGAAGHSAGGTTTNGLFTKHRDPRLKVGIVIAGRPLGSYTGSPAPMLFLHGDRDPVVAYDQGRTAYASVPWPKAFLTVLGGEHGAGLGDLERGHQQSMSTMLDFLRWALDRDRAALGRLDAGGTLPGVTAFESVGVHPTESHDSSSHPATASTTTATRTAPTMSGSLALAVVG